MVNEQPRAGASGGPMPTAMRRRMRRALCRGGGAVLVGAVALTVGSSGHSPHTAVAQEPQKVTVKPGDTLSGIAVRFYGTSDAVSRILAANRLADADKVLAGTTLVIPASGDVSSTSASTGSTAASNSGSRTVVVEAGDSLGAIANRVYGSSDYASALAAANNITDPDHIVVGMKLTAPTSIGRPSAPAAAPAVGSAATGTGARPVGAAGQPLAGARICVDPGHGGKAESGAAFTFSDGTTLREADVTLDVSRTLRAWLQADGATVTMTRTDDTFVPLDARAVICNTAGADLTVSVHLNGVDNPAMDGALALFAKLVDKRPAQLLFQSLYTGLSRNAPSSPFTAYGAQPFDGAVLLGTSGPAVIVEPVFLTNSAEARALQAPTSQANSRRNQIVLETYRGIRLYFGGGQ